MTQYRTGKNAVLSNMAEQLPVPFRAPLAANVGIANNDAAATLVLTKAEGDTLRAEIEAIKTILINLGIMAAS